MTGNFTHVASVSIKHDILYEPMWIGARHITSSITVSTTKIVLSLISYDFIKRRPMLSHFITCTSMCQIYKSNISENRGFCCRNEDYYKVKRVWITQLPSEALIYKQGHRAGTEPEIDSGQEFGRAPSIGAEQPWHKAPLACHWYPAILLLHSIAFNVGWEPTLNLLSTQIMHQHVDVNFGF